MGVEKEPTRHVVYIITKLELGGAQKVCLSLVEGFAGSKAGASLISGQSGELVEQARKHDTVYLLPSLKREVRFKQAWNDIKTFFSLIRRLRTLKKQHGLLIVHTHSTKAGIIGRWAAFFARAGKRVHTVHGYAFNNYQWRIKWFAIYLSELFTSFITSHFVCVSQKDYQTGCHLFPRFAKKSSVIRAAVEDRFFVPAQKVEKEFGKKQAKFIIGTVSCFKPQKNLFDLLKAFKVVHDTCMQNKNFRPQLHIIGDGAERQKIEQWMADNNLKSAVVLLGWQKDVQPWLEMWHAFALSSLWEGLPCSVVEARLNQLPVVAYDVGGISEVISSGTNGFLVKPGNWQELAERLLSLINDRVLYESLAKHQDSLDDFANQSMIVRHAGLYQQLEKH